MTYKVDGTYITVCPRDCFGSCSLEASVEDGKVVKIKGSKINKNSEGRLCVKGLSYVKRLSHSDRLRYPLLKDGKTGGFNRITWDEALKLIANKLNGYRQDQLTESVMYINSWGHTGVFNDYANYFWNQYGRVTTAYGGLCNNAGKLGVKYTYGDVVKHNNNADLENASLIIIWGSNPANTNIHRMHHIKNAMKKGTQVIVIDPRVSESMVEGTVNIHPRPGSDGLLAMGVAKRLIEKDICDKEFIDAYVLGFQAYTKHLENYSYAYILSKTGLEMDDLERIVSAIEKNPIYALVTGTGKSRYSNGGQAERAVCSLPALTGSIGLKGGGCYFTDNQTPKFKWPVFNTVTDYQMMPKIHIGKISQDLKSLTPAIKFLWIEKANPLTSSPNVNEMKKMMASIDFKVVLDHFMTDTALEADLVLPAAMFAEKDDLINVYGDSYVHLLQKLIDPLEECKSEPEIYRALGQVMGLDLNQLPLVDPDFITDFLKFNGINTDYQQLTQAPYMMEDYSDIAFEDKIFKTPSGKIELYSEQMLEWGESPLPTYRDLKESKEETPELFEKYPIYLLSAHPKERINAQFIEMKLSTKHEIPEIEIHPSDAEKREIGHGDMVRVFNDYGQLFIRADVKESVKEGMVNLYEGWDEAHGACANKLIYGRMTDIGQGTAYYDCLVEIEKA